MDIKCLNIRLEAKFTCIAAASVVWVKNWYPVDGKTNYSHVGGGKCALISVLLYRVPRNRVGV